MMRRRHGIALLAALALLAGCGSDDQSTGKAKLLRDTLGAVLQRGEAKPVGAQDLGLTRAALAGVSTPLALATVEATGASALIAPFGRNNGVVTWSSTDKKTLAMRDGVLVATRGLGADLMSSVAPTAAQIGRGAGSHERVYFHIDGLDQTVRSQFRCTLATQGAKIITVVERNYATNLVQERCEGPTGAFTNEFWVENGTFIRQSRQTVDQKLGKVQIQRIID